MKLQHIPLVMFAGSAVLFGVCAVLELVAGQVAIGVVFGVIAIAAIALFLALHSGRIRL